MASCPCSTVSFFDTAQEAMSIYTNMLALLQLGLCQAIALPEAKVRA